MEDKTAAVKTLSFLVVTMALYLLLWQILLCYGSFPVYYYGRLIEALAMLLFVALALWTPMRFEEMGIVVPKGRLFRSLAIGGGAALLFVAILWLYHPIVGKPVMFSLRLREDISRVTYFVVAPFQEILAKSVMLCSFERVLDHRHPRLANLMSALTFGAFHVVYGVRMMWLSMALSLVTGWIFHKERCVWGCAVTHFACGFFPACFGI